MTLDASTIGACVPQWRQAESKVLKRTVQVRRPTVGDIALPVAEMWLRLVRDGDGTPLFPPHIKPSEADPELVEEIVALACIHPTPAVAGTAC